MGIPRVNSSAQWYYAIERGLVGHEDHAAPEAIKEVMMERVGKRPSAATSKPSKSLVRQ
jgi:hypothetical protein